MSGYYNVRAFALGNFIYGVGGTNPIPVPLETTATYRYDPATNTWDDAAIANLFFPGIRAEEGFVFTGGAVVSAGKEVPTVLGWARFFFQPRIRGVVWLFGF